MPPRHLEDDDLGTSDHSSSEAPPRKRAKRARRARRPKQRNRAGLGNHGDVRQSRIERLANRWDTSTRTLQNVTFSMTEDARASSTGWQGVNLKPVAREALAAKLESGEMTETLSHFFPVYYQE